MRKNYFISIILSLFLFLLFTSSVKAATYTVTKTADTLDGTCDADCSFREAIVASNANSGADTINFNIPTSDGGFVAASGSTQAYFQITSNVSSAVNITDDSGVFINGYSQSGAARNTAAFGEPINTILKIRFSFSAVNGTFTVTGDNNHFAGLSITTANNNNFTFNTSSNNWIEGNYFGSDITGMTASNNGSIVIGASSTGNIFGTNGDGTGDVGERNLFDGTGNNNNGRIQSQDGSSGTIIAGNYFGVDKTGRTCGGGTKNRQNIELNGPNHRIGTNYDGISDSEEANIIACINTSARAEIRVGVIGVVTNSYIQGNYIGTNTYGDNLTSFVIPGISARTGELGGRGNTIKGNVIAFNGDAGIDLRVDSSTGNRITQNSIYSNGALGIDNTNDGVTPNDAGDIDTGANDLMNFPVLKKIVRSGNNLEVTADLDLKASEGPFTIELFDNDALDSSGYGEGQYFIGSVTTSVIGNNVVLTIPITGRTPSSSSQITSTATNSNGSTSEFSTVPLDTTYYTTFPNSSLNSSSNSSAPSCTDAKPDSAPQLFQINTQSNNATLFFAPSANNTSKYFIAYGYDQGDERFGVEFNENNSNSAITYTINSLEPNQTYYFKVRGGNGCMPAEWSNSLKATTLNKNSLNTKVFTAWEQMHDTVLSWIH